MEGFAAHCKVFVLHHGTPPEQRRPYLELVNLNDLVIPETFRGNYLAESRFYLADLPTKSQAFIGLATGRWDQKFAGQIKLGDLYLLEPLLSPNHVIAPAMARPVAWVPFSDDVHSGMGSLIREMAEVCGDRIGTGPTLWANNFICHRDVYGEFLVTWKKLFEHFYKRYGFDPPFSIGDCDGSRKFAYLAERFTAFYFAGRTDLKLISVPKARRS